MKKSMLAASLVLVLSLTSCTWFQKAGCELETSLVKGVSAGIVSALQCSNPSQVENDVMNVAKGMNMCQPQQTGIVADLCKTLSSLLISQVAPKTIPAAWGCTMGNASALLSSAVALACDKIPAVHQN